MLAERTLIGHYACVPSEWQNADAWFFECVGALMPDGGDLQRIIEIGDYINRSVFNHDEIEGAVRRLAGSGLVTAGDLHFGLTEAGQAIRAHAPVGSTVFDRTKWFRSYLDDHVWCEEVKAWQLPLAAYDSAFASYQARMREAVDRLR